MTTLPLAVRLAKLPDSARRRVLTSLDEVRAHCAHSDWRFWALEKQLPPPGDWMVWLLLAGRGFGKTRAGAEYTCDVAQEKLTHRIALVGRTTSDVRHVMVEGQSGILAVARRRGFVPTYEPSKRRLQWPNGVIATTYSADKPELLRGPEHGFAWADEIAVWRFTEAWDNLLLSLRLGTRPHVVATTTPKPRPLIRRLLDPSAHRVVVTRASSRENPYLSSYYRDHILRQYEGTRLGRQEIYAELLEDNPGALWTRTMIDAARVTTAPELARIVVGVDPGVASFEAAAETGIIVAGLAADGHAYVLEDSSLRDSPARWGAQVVSAYHTFAADVIVAEVNNGGEMVAHTIRTTPGGSTLPIEQVRASRGKRTRAEPIAALYEQGRVHHVGYFPELEDQLCEWEPDAGGASPDRLDALVWALTALFRLDEAAPAPGALDAIDDLTRASRWRGRWG